MPEPRVWRLFVAAPMPAPAAEQATRVLAALRGRHPEARWLPLHKLHLTLVFLGQIDVSRVKSLAAATAAVAARHHAFEVVTGDGGGRVHTVRGGVCWLRLKGGGRETAQLALDLDESFGSRIYDANHPPHPHLTLARGVDQATLRDVQRTAEDLTFKWTADRLVLFRSYTDPAGSVYEELHSSPLAS